MSRPPRAEPRKSVIRRSAGSFGVDHSTHEGRASEEQPRCDEVLLEQLCTAHRTFRQHPGHGGQARGSSSGGCPPGERCSPAH